MVTYTNCWVTDSSEGEYFEIKLFATYEIDLSMWDDLFIIIDYLWEYIT